jgi:hypothetical protein
MDGYTLLWGVPPHLDNIVCEGWALNAVSVNHDAFKEAQVLLAVSNTVG